MVKQTKSQKKKKGKANPIDYRLQQTHGFSKKKKKKKKKNKNKNKNKNKKTNKQNKQTNKPKPNILKSETNGRRNQTLIDVERKQET